jgi:dephospho-CoA kinase
MKNVGLTGGLGAGKSTARRYFYAFGANTMDADDIAKHLLGSNPDLIRRVKERFGEDCYADGELQRAVLAERAFCSTEKQQELNAIVHPSLREYVRKYLDACRMIPGVMIVEAALLFEAQFQDLFDLTILITAGEELRVRRMSETGKITEKEARRRIALQMPEEEKRKFADIIIENNGGPDLLKAACLSAWKESLSGGGQ